MHVGSVVNLSFCVLFLFTQAAHQAPLFLAQPILKTQTHKNEQRFGGFKNKIEKKQNRHLPPPVFAIQVRNGGS